MARSQAQARARETECDVVVVGSGAGGLSAAVTAAFHGLKVVVVEKEPMFGGTTAWSGGWMSIPRNPLARRAGIVEDVETIRAYLRAEIGNHYDAARIDAFLEEGPAMVAFYEQHTAVQFVDGNQVPDMHGRQPGAGTGGRSVCAAPFDGRALGPLIRRMRRPLPEIAFFGMGIASGADLKHFLNVTRSTTSAFHVGRRFTKHLADLAVHRRGMHIVNGNALVARLAKSAADLGVEIKVSAPVTGLIREDGAVRGAVVAIAKGEWTIRARRGVVLACGGFPGDAERRRQLFPHAPTGAEHWTAAPRSNTGDGLRLGEAAGGHVDSNLAAPAAWAPVSLVPRRDGTFGHFPHLIDRAKPGFIAVDGGRPPLRQRGAELLRLYRRPAAGSPARRRGGELGHLRSPLPAPLRPRLRQADAAAGQALYRLGLPQARPHAGGAGGFLRHRARKAWAPRWSNTTPMPATVRIRASAAAARPTSGPAAMPSSSPTLAWRPSTRRRTMR